jgi:tetratricopeptide (TPR) repeat protein
MYGKLPPIPRLLASSEQPFEIQPMSSSLTKGLRRSASRSKAKPTAAKSAKRAVKAKSSSKPKARRATATKPARKAAVKVRAAKKGAAKPKAITKARRAAPKPLARKAAPAKKLAVSRVKTTQKQAAVRAVRAIPTPPPPPRPPTQDESAALLAFERAHKEFARGRFAEARNQFRILVDKHSQVAEVAARARTYLAIAESRLRTESILPRDADSLYDRGVIELNRGEYVAAQEMFERALKREPEAAHIHYGLAATRARLGSIDLALESLQRALDLQPSLRVRAQHDHDLNPLRNDPDFDRLIFSNPS